MYFLTPAGAQPASVGIPGTTLAAISQQGGFMAAEGKAVGSILTTSDRGSQQVGPNWTNIYNGQTYTQAYAYSGNPSTPSGTTLLSFINLSKSFFIIS